MEQIKRIAEMESILNAGLSAVSLLELALDQYIALQDELAVLEDYYRSPAWRRDFESDEAGALPPDLPRGVLSEDGIYTLLSARDELLARMRTLLPREAEEKP